MRKSGDSYDAEGGRWRGPSSARKNKGRLSWGVASTNGVDGNNTLPFKEKPIGKGVSGWGPKC